MENEVNSSAAEGTSESSSEVIQPSGEATAPQTATDGTGPASSASTAPAKAGDASGQSGVDLQAEVDKWKRSHQEARTKMAAMGAEKNLTAKELGEVKKQLSELAAAFAKATETPYDPEQFIETLKSQGPEFINKLIADHLKKQQSASEEKYTSLATEQKKLSVKIAYKDRVADAENYPNFKEMEPTMDKVFKTAVQNYLDGKSDFDPRSLDSDELMDQLYAIAKLQHSQDALKKAEAHGREQAEAGLAREAETSVAAGGKHVGSKIVDPTSLPPKEHRQWLIDRGIVSGF